MELLQELTSIQGVSGDEARIKEFILDYTLKNQHNWKTEPKIIEGKGFQDCLILVFGEPTTAIYAHTDTIGFTVGYNNELIKVGGPQTIDGMELIGKDSRGEIETQLLIIEDEEHPKQLKCVFDREIDRGTLLSFKPNFRLDENYVQSPYLDNRLGVWNALQVAETLENGAIVFGTYEEHGGNSVGYCAKYLLEEYAVHQALISDITWVTEGVTHGKGVAVSMRDQYIPRKSYLDKIISIAKESSVDFQLEVESAGGSDGGALQKSDLPIDWCFIGAAEDNVHTPDEKVHLKDIQNMVELYKKLMEEL